MSIDSNISVALNEFIGDQLPPKSPIELKDGSIVIRIFLPLKRSRQHISFSCQSSLEGGSHFISLFIGFVLFCTLRYV